MKFEKLLQTAFVSHVLSPQKRKYMTINAYEYLMKEDYGYSDMLKVITIDKKKRQ